MNGELAKLEQRLRALVASLQPPMTEAQAREVLHFVDVAEYGVALETLGSLLSDEGLRPAADRVREMQHLAKEMGLDPSDWDF